MTIKTFPWKHWGDARNPRWAEELVKWFLVSYETSQEGVMKELVYHLAEVLRETRSDKEKEQVKDVAKLLLQTCRDQPAEFTDHHALVIELFSTGLHEPLSHLFMVPGIQVPTLLNVVYYPKVLMATRLLTQERYDEVLDLTRNIDCCIADYVVGQAHRRQDTKDSLSQADAKFDSLQKQLERPEFFRSCPIGDGHNCVCDRSLLEAELYRARAVVYRRMADKSSDQERKSEYKQRSREYCDKALLALGNVDLDEKPAFTASEKDVPALRPTERGEKGDMVEANVLFSCGYAKYSLNEFDAASKQFQQAIKIVDKNGAHWDPPYTRVAIILLLENKEDEARTGFFKAINHCERTFDTNLEARLSVALCYLGLCVIDLDYDRVVRSSNEKMMKRHLETALRQKPPLSAGPINCHTNDAKKIEKACRGENASRLVTYFVSRLETRLSEIDRVHQSGGDGIAEPETFDCFLCHNSADKPSVRALARKLRTLGISVWLDEEQIRPGVPGQPLIESGILNSRTVAVLVGRDGIGPWENIEMQSALTLAVENPPRPVIPVLLHDDSREPRLPLFLSQFKWVRLGSGDRADKNSGLDELVWGITGKREVENGDEKGPEQR